LLFVYGTLLTNAGHPLAEQLQRRGRKLGTGSIRARLYIIDDPDDPGRNSYPGAVPSADPADRVHGEVHELEGDTTGLFSILDDFEACSARWPEPHEFLRRSMTVEMTGGDRLEATVYLYTWDVTRARYIASGRYDGSLGAVR
jgi:gamma-glutamylcyclotransferase (GGCT)/AIG2-like uncharacterized protein YtfP